MSHDVSLHTLASFHIDNGGQNGSRSHGRMVAQSTAVLAESTSASGSAGPVWVDNVARGKCCPGKCVNRRR